MFRLRKYVGLSLIYASLGVFQFVQVFLTNELNVEVAPGIYFSFASMVLFTSNLFVVLLLYLRVDALEARKAIYAIIFVNVFFSLLLLCFQWLIENGDVTISRQLPDSYVFDKIWILFYGTLLLLIDLFVLMFVYEFISKFTKRYFWKIFLTMTLVMSLDSVLFSTGVFFNNANYENILISNVLSKSLGSFVYSCMFVLYIVYFDSDNGRVPTTYKDIFDKLTFKQRYEEISKDLDITAKELRKSEAQYEKLANLTIEGILIHKKGVAIDCNRSFQNLFGYTRDELIGISLEEKLVHKDSQKLLKEKITTGDTTLYEINAVRKDGTVFPAEVEARNIEDEDGDIRVSSIRDITDRKLLEKAIEEGEFDLKRAEKIAQLGTFSLDLLTMDFRSSKIFDDMTGIGPNQHKTFELWKSIRHPDDAWVNKKMMEDALLYHQKFDREYRIINLKTKEERWIHGLGEFSYEDGHAIKFAGTIQDITLRKVNEIAIQENEKKLLEVQKIGNIGMFEMDMESQVLTSSPIFDAIVEAKHNEKITLSSWWQSFVHPEDYEYHQALWLDSMAKGEVYDEEYRILSKSSLGYKWVHAVVYTFEDASNRTKIIGTLQDITKRKLAEINLIENEKQLIDSQEIAELGTYSVDLRTERFTSSDIFNKILGLKPGHRTSFDFLKEVAHPDDLDESNRILDDCIATGKKYINKLRIIDQTTHKIKWVSCIAKIDYENGVPSYFAGIIRDVTQEEREAKTKEIVYNITKKANGIIAIEDFFYYVKEQLGQLINTTNFLIALYDEKTDLISTPYMVDEYDDQDSFPKGKTLTGYVITNKSALLTKSNRIPGKIDDEILIPLGPESKCWLGVPLLIDDNAIGAIVVQSYTDKDAYTEHDVQLLELIAANVSGVIKEVDDAKQINLLNQALVQISGIVMITNHEAQLEYVNPSFTAITGYEFEEVIGKNPSFLNPKIHLVDFYETIQKAVDKYGNWRDELVQYKKDGSRFMASITISPVKNEKGEIAHYVIVSEDITEKKHLERQFINAIIEAQDIEKQNFGEELHDSISQILSAESMYIEMLIEQNQDRIDGKAKFLKKIKELNATAVNETRNIAHGLMTKQLEQSGLLASVANICIDFKVTNNIDFSFVNQGVLENELSKEIRINVFRIIQELSTNINRYSKATKAEIRFSKRENGILLVVVSDNGIGFEYERGNSFEGVGLHTVQRRIIFLNGTMNLDTAPGKGTQITFEIPL
tara:strand:- start:250670 stop:254377 length:3708 start_codon:yes stop_codon:yes gene_type:complete